MEKNYKIEKNHLIFNNDALYIEDKFTSKNINRITFSNKIDKIPDFCFYKNKIRKLILNDNIKYIGNYGFSSNKIEKLTLPKSLVEIGKCAFLNNNLRKVIISDGTKEIDFCAFYDNPLELIVIPKTVIKIGKDAFLNTDVIYDGTLLDRKLINKFNAINVVEINEALKSIKKDELIKFPEYVFNIIPKDNDSLKGYLYNYKKYIKILEENKIEDINKKGVFKLCYVLGLFHWQNNNVIKLINRIIKEEDQGEISKNFENITLRKYDSKYSNTIFKLYDENKYKYNDRNLIATIYKDFDNIKKCTLKTHEIKSYKKNIKEITFDDIIYYLHNKTFKVSDDALALKSIIDVLLLYVTSLEYEKLEYLYKVSIGIKKCIDVSSLDDRSKEDVKYKWLNSSDPTNLILGYLCKCCAKLGGQAEDIMVQSMINPNIINLVIYNKNKIIAKSTGYFNLKENYILFNNIETINLKEDVKEKCFVAIKRAIYDVVLYLKNQGIIINNVNIGMKENDLYSQIVKNDCEIITNNLLESYDFNNYIGDAYLNQAVIYKDDNKNKLVK